MGKTIEEIQDRLRKKLYSKNKKLELIRNTKNTIGYNVVKGICSIDKNGLSQILAFDSEEDRNNFFDNPKFKMEEIDYLKCDYGIKDNSIYFTSENNISLKYRDGISIENVIKLSRKMEREVVEDDKKEIIS